MVPAVPPAVPVWTARRVMLATLVVCAVALAFWLLYQFYIVPFIVFVALVLGTAIRPLVERLYRLGVPRPLGVVLVYIVLLALVAGVARLTAPLFSEQISTIAGKVPDYYQSLRKLLLSTPSRLIFRLAQELPAQLALPTGGAVANATAAAQSSAGQSAAGQAALSGVATALGYIELIGRGIFVATSILVLAFYWTLDGERTLRGLLLHVPSGPRENARDIIDTMQAKVSAYVVGQTIVCLSVGVMALIAYIVIGLPYALVLAVLAAILEAVPVVGPILGAVPPALLALSLAPGKFIWVVIAVIVIQQAENNLLVPRVMDRSVGVNPIVTILSIAAFAGLFGLPGAILAIPLAAIIQVLIDRFVLGSQAPDLEQPAGRDRLSLLRYSAQELVQDVRKQVRDKEDLVERESDQLEDMIESIATDLDSLLAQAGQEGEARRTQGEAAA